MQKKGYKKGINGEDWHLVSPEGKHYIFNCLREWLRGEGEGLFTQKSSVVCNAISKLKHDVKEGKETDWHGWKIILDTEQKRKPRKPARHIEIGKTYGGMKVLSLAEGKPRRYVCACVKCGAQSEMQTQAIFANQHGCIDCYIKERSKKLEAEAKSHIGEKHGSLTITDVFLTYTRDPKITIWGAKCLCDCGKSSDFILSDVMADFAVCGFCKQREQRISKGITKRGKKFYCDIAFRFLHKNSFHLGSYSDFSEAVKVKKTAEMKKSEGTFLDWYKETFPKRWEKVKKSCKNHPRAFY